MNLDALAALAEAATPGPWEATRDPKAKDDWWLVHTDTDILAMTGQQEAAYIAAADPTAILALIARLRAAEAVCEAARTLVNGLPEDNTTNWRALRAALDAWGATR